MTVSEMLKALRGAGVSQAELGQLVGLSQPTICRALAGADLKYEAGKRVEGLYELHIVRGVPFPSQIVEQPASKAA